MMMMLMMAIQIPCPQGFALLPAWRMVLSNVWRNVAQNSSSLSVAFPTQSIVSFMTLLTTVLALVLRITFLTDKYHISQCMSIKYLWRAQHCVSMLDLVLALRALKYLDDLPQKFRAFKASLWTLDSPSKFPALSSGTLYTTECLHSRQC